MKSKRISIIALAFIMLFSAVFGVSNLFLAKAEETTETLEQKLERFTSSDEIEGENMEIKINSGVYPTMITPYKNGEIDYKIGELIKKYNINNADERCNNDTRSRILL